MTGNSNSTISAKLLGITDLVIRLAYSLLLLLERESHRIRCARLIPAGTGV